MRDPTTSGVAAGSRSGAPVPACDHLLHVLEANEDRFGEYRFLAFEGRSWTNRALFDASARFAHELGALGVRPGDRVLAQLPNGPEIWVVLLACGRLGAVLVPTLPVLTSEELTFVANDCGAAVAVGDRAGIEKLRGGPIACPALRVCIATEPTPLADAQYEPMTRGARLLRRIEGSPGDVAALIYTSGSTGRPKGVMLTHRNLTAQARLSFDLYVAAGEDSRHNSILMALPLCHVYGLTVALTTLLMGNVMVLMRRFAAEEAVQWIHRERIRIVPAVPTMLVRLLRVPEAPALCRSVVQWDCGGAPLARDVIEAVEQRLGGVVTEGWGLSEASGPVAQNTRDRPQKPGSVGPAFPGLELRAVDDEGKDVPPGAVGELLVRGPTVMRGYWGRPERTAEVLRDGWLHTGDLGILDEDGDCTIVGRKDDLILRAGENVAPREIEEALAIHPAVEEAAVVGVPDPELGEAVLAFVVLRPGAQASAEELRRHAAGRLAPFKRPARIAFVAELPRNSLGKVQRSLLKEELVR